MKLLAFQAGVMEHHGGTLLPDDFTGQADGTHPWTFEEHQITALGIIGPGHVVTTLRSCLERHRKLDSALLQRIATYEVAETHWSALIAVEDLEGVFYLSRIPGTVSRLVYHPLANRQGIVVTHRAAKPKFTDKKYPSLNAQYFIDRCSCAVSQETDHRPFHDSISPVASGA